MQQHTEALQQIGEMEEAEEVISTRETLGISEKLSDFTQLKHPEKAARREAAPYNVSGPKPFRNILKGRMTRNRWTGFYDKWWLI